MKIYQAMANVMASISAIGKDKHNPQGNFKFRGIDDVYNSLHRAMAAEGIFCTMEVLDHRSEPRQFKNSSGFQVYTTVKYSFHTVDGSSVSSTVVGEAMDSGDKATNKTYAIAHKYALLQAFLIPTEDMQDPDSEKYELSEVSQNTVQAINELENLDDLKSAYHAMSVNDRKIYASTFKLRKEQLEMRPRDTFRTQDAAA